MSIRGTNTFLFLFLLGFLVFHACAGSSGGTGGNSETGQNLAPAISSVSPEICTMGGAGFTITVNGSKCFTPNLQNIEMEGKLHS